MPTPQFPLKPINQNFSVMRDSSYIKHFKYSFSNLSFRGPNLSKQLKYLITW